MSRKRAHVPLTTKLASCLAELQYLRGDPIPFGQLKVMSAAHLVSLYHFDHAELHTLTANDHFTNFTPRLILPHREKTKRDLKQLAHGRKVARANAAHKAKMAEKMMPVDVRGDKADGHSSRPKPKKKWPKRSFPQQQRGFR